MCPFVPSEKPLEEEPMDVSIPKVHVPWGSPWVTRYMVGKRHSGGVAEEIWDGLTHSCHSVSHLMCCATQHQEWAAEATLANLILEGPSQVIQVPIQDWSLFSTYTAPKHCVVLVSRSTVVCGTYLHITRLAHPPQKRVFASWMEASLGGLQMCLFGFVSGL